MSYIDGYPPSIFYFLLLLSKDTVTDKRINRMNTSSTSLKTTKRKKGV